MSIAKMPFDERKDLFKILIGAAWLDGIIQPEERQYLHQMAQQHQLDADPEIKRLLSEMKAIAPSECQQWITDFVQRYNSTSDYNDLLEALSALIYSDGEVQTEEAKLLVQVQSLDPHQTSSEGLGDRVLKAIQKLYRQAVKTQDTSDR